MRTLYHPRALMLTSAVMALMRETAYGHETRKEVRNTCFRAETMRNDEALQQAAEAKRQRKQAKRAKAAGSKA